MDDVTEKSLIQNQKILYWAIGIVLIIWSIGLFPFHRIDSKETLNNPSNARYYVTLQSILANYPLLSADHANVRLIKNRLVKFEKDIHQKSHHHAAVTAPYLNDYKNVLNKFGISSVKRVKGRHLLVSIASKCADIVDRFYLDDQLFRINQLYSWQPEHERRILQYNLAPLFNRMPDRYMRILAAYTNDSQLGVYSGFFVNNQTTTMETQFMTGLPMLTALYVMPRYDYNLTGSLSTMVPWGYFGAHSLVDPVIRKVLDISGIDVFSVLKSQMTSVGVTDIPGATPFKSDIMPLFSTDYIPYINQQSYGMSYLANHIIRENPQDIRLHEDAIRHYFSRPIDHDPKLFVDTTHLLYQKLLLLKDRHDIILEKNSVTELGYKNNMPAGTSVVKGIIGERALLDVECQRPQCTLVLNIANSSGWHAFVNGKEGVIARANFAFMATDVPQGHSKVWFIYSPFVSLVSYFISVLTLIWLLTVCKRKSISGH